MSVNARHKGIGTIAALSALLLSLAVAACSGSENSHEPATRTGQLRIRGEGVERFRKPGGDNSLQGYGHEASRADLARAARAVHGYLVAWVEEDWPSACSLGSSELHQVLERASELSPETRGQGCVKTIREVASGEPPLAKTAYEATDMKAEGLRQEGNFGYLFFYLGKTAYQQEVFREDGRWGVKAPLPSPVE
jgi:hypothetical protein